jgi:hypothetical protein
MKKAWWIAVIPGILALIAGYIIIVLLLVKLLWAWTIPDLFPGAVEQGLVAGEISWITAFKVAVFVAVFAGLAGVRRGSES